VLKDARIMRLGQASKLVELPAGCHVSLRLSVDEKAVIEVNVERE